MMLRLRFSYLINIRDLDWEQEILNRLLHIGHQANLDHVVAEILPDNAIMKRINEKLDFPVKNNTFEHGLVKATFALN